MGKASLTDFASSHPPRCAGPGAWLESIPEWPEILVGWKAGITQAQIRRWLIEERGYDAQVATRNRVAHLTKQYPRASNG